VAALADRPTLIVDATLPDLALIRPFYPTVQTVAELEAAMPHVRLRYIPDAPTAAKKFSKGDPSGRNAREPQGLLGAEPPNSPAGGRSREHLRTLQNGPFWLLSA
jgi:hypothetical protein